MCRSKLSDHALEGYEPYLGYATDHYPACSKTYSRLRLTEFYLRYLASAQDANGNGFGNLGKL
jgi:hypothetical protein